ncbi:MAG: hypothetical protein LBS42_00935 [Tannerella sp.]|jgi:hypothetical protein|nr:hypothetical protein [Tannerella sp.]
MKRTLFILVSVIGFALTTNAQPRPANPDLSQLKKDLTGRRISDMPDGWHHKDWYWQVKSADELKEVTVTKIIRRGNDLIYCVHLILQGEANQHEADLRVTYIVHEKKWQIAVIETVSMKIVRTNRYNKCVTAQIKGWSGEYELELTNRCDRSLVVGGVILSEFDGKWQKFTTVVDANTTGSVGGLFSISVKDYKIHFIERP